MGQLFMFSQQLTKAHEMFKQLRYLPERLPMRSRSLAELRAQTRAGADSRLGVASLPQTIAARTEALNVAVLTDVGVKGKFYA